MTFVVDRTGQSLYDELRGELDPDFTALPGNGHDLYVDTLGSITRTELEPIQQVLPHPSIVLGTEWGLVIKRTKEKPGLVALIGRTPLEQLTIFDTFVLLEVGARKEAGMRVSALRDAMYARASRIGSATARNSLSRVRTAIPDPYHWSDSRAANFGDGHVTLHGVTVFAGRAVPANKRCHLPS